MAATSRTFARALRCFNAPSKSISSCELSSRSLFSPRSRLPSLTQSRAFSITPLRLHGHVTPPKPGEELHVTFIDKDSHEHTLEVSAGDNLLDVAQAHDLEMEGACGGSCACSTCHVIVTDEAMYDRMPEPEDDENDMLDLAFGLTETSRLGCQVTMTKELDGLRVKLPSMTRNLQASDFGSK
ncbi:mitochondrial matrix iron-sulfur protein [Apiospora saccharicola]